MTATAEESHAERKRIKWSGATLHKRRHKALVKRGSQRIVVNRSRVRTFNRQQTIELLKAKGDERNKSIYTQDFGRVTRVGSKAIDLLAQILEKHIARVNHFVDFDVLFLRRHPSHRFFFVFFRP